LLHFLHSLPLISSRPLDAGQVNNFDENSPVLDTYAHQIIYICRFESEPNRLDAGWIRIESAGIGVARDFPHFKRRPVVLYRRGGERSPTAQRDAISWPATVGGPFDHSLTFLPPFGPTEEVPAGLPTVYHTRARPAPNNLPKRCAVRSGRRSTEQQQQ